MYHKLKILKFRKRVIEEFPFITKFTCDECYAKYSCIYAFDPFNTEGDCLEMK